MKLIFCFVAAICVGTLAGSCQNNLINKNAPDETQEYLTTGEYQSRLKDRIRDAE